MLEFDVLGWAGALYLVGLAGVGALLLGLLWAARAIERRLDRIIELLERD